MEKEVQQLMEMGATAAQARAALKDCKDVMDAAERIFEGKYSHLANEGMEVDGTGDERKTTEQKSARMITPDEDDGDAYDDEGEDDYEDFADYDSDSEFQPAAKKAVVDVDPYAGIFFSKERREEVIEVEEEPETVFIKEWDTNAKVMTQGEWMKGCPEGGEQSFLFGLYSQLTEAQCQCPHRCGTSVPRKKSDFFTISSDFTKYIQRLKRIVKQQCPSCSKEFCFACGELINSEKSSKSSPDTRDDDVLFHCPNLQGVILGMGLAAVEQLYSEQIQQTPSEQDGQVRDTKRRKVETASAAGTPDDDLDPFFGAHTAKGKKNKSGIGYAGAQREDNTGQIQALALQRSKDEKLAELLRNVRWFLPSTRRSGGGRTSDYLVHPTALAHLRRRFNHICSSLLKNDSLADMSDRSALYHEVLDWLETISDHEALASMMAMPIMVVASVKTLPPKKSSNGSVPVRERTIVYEGSSGPRELLESLVLQAQAALKSLAAARPTELQKAEMSEEAKRVTIDTKGKSKEAEPGLSDDGLKLAKFCERIISTAAAIDRFLRETKGDAFVERLLASLPKLHSSGSDDIQVDVAATEDMKKKQYMEWASRVRFEYCDLTVPAEGTDDDQTPSYKFYYNNEARMLANSDMPKRSLAVAKELAVLTTNLPVAWDSSIFLRIDETRVDIIKALITGPEGTPYHNGCYLFDIFLGGSYNQAPPSVKYMTTNGGKYRFNPNLYADGKVCLSLLGTWQGPGWIPGKSTLLQVLISIQSMILCDEPYLNEPGWANCGGSPESRAYSANVRRMVVRTAMLGNLKNPPEPFGDIIRTHFKLKARNISAQLDQWLAEDDGRPTSGEGNYGMTKQHASGGGGSSNGFHRDVEELKQLLDRLQVGETVSSS